MGEGGGRQREGPIYDVYRKKKQPMERMATLHGAGLPSHLDPKDWELMPAGTSPVIDDAADDIAARGFCYFTLIE
jgi:hypothetical protein